MPVSTWLSLIGSVAETEAMAYPARDGDYEDDIDEVVPHEESTKEIIDVDNDDNDSDEVVLLE